MARRAEHYGAGVSLKIRGGSVGQCANEVEELLEETGRTFEAGEVAPATQLKVLSLPARTPEDVAATYAAAQTKPPAADDLHQILSVGDCEDVPDGDTLLAITPEDEDYVIREIANDDDDDTPVWQDKQIDLGGEG
jgi:hypothetical protein